MAEKAFHRSEYLEGKGEDITKTKRVSGFRVKKSAEVMDHIREQINEFRREKIASGFPEGTLKAEDEKDDFFDFETEAGKEQNTDRPFFDEDRLKMMIIRHCGKLYWDFLESGHPLARFWVQLKNGIEVIPRSEYVYYIQSLLDRKIEGGESLGSSKMKIEFMKKFGFASDTEVEEYLLTILGEDEVENIIGVE